MNTTLGTVDFPVCNVVSLRPKFRPMPVQLKDRTYPKSRLILPPQGSRRFYTLATAHITNTKSQIRHSVSFHSIPFVIEINRSPGVLSTHMLASSSRTGDVPPALKSKRVFPLTFQCRYNNMTDITSHSSTRSEREKHAVRTTSLICNNSSVKNTTNHRHSCHTTRIWSHIRHSQSCQPTHICSSSRRLHIDTDVRMAIRPQCTMYTSQTPIWNKYHHIVYIYNLNYSFNDT